MGSPFNDPEPARSWPCEHIAGGGRGSTAAAKIHLDPESYAGRMGVGLKLTRDHAGVWRLGNAITLSKMVT